MNIADILKAQTETSPETAAIIDAHHGNIRTLTFAQMEVAAARAASLLHQAGLKAGDGVLVFHPMSAELYIALAAIFRLGLVALFLDPSAGKVHIERCCALYPPKGLIASSRAHLLRLVAPAVRRIPVKFSIGLPVPGALNWASSRHIPPLDEIHPCGPEVPALITLTSGSTGACKAAVRTHGFLLAQHKVLEKNLKLKTGERDLSTLPIFVLANMASGVTSVIPDADLTRPGSIDPVPVISQIKLLKPSRTAASPALLERLASSCLERNLTLPELSKIFVGGAPVFPRLLTKLKLVAPAADITAVYGSTEAEPIAELAHLNVRAGDVNTMLRGGGLLAGVVVSEVDLRIIPDQWGKAIGPFTREEFSAACLASNHNGEIVVSGDHVLHGYLHGRGDEENKFTVEHTRWHRTGDAGYIDAKGRLWLLGRCSARIQDRYGTLYPFAVECAAQDLEGVRRAAVLSYHNRRILAVEPTGSLTKNKLPALNSLLVQAHIDTIRLLRTIPVDRRHNAKIDYPALLRLLDAA